ncbi:MAG: hypothetical protein ABIF08_02335 [Nanoarchaeota archaeon]
MYDMLVRKKLLKIQERLGMRIGIMHGTNKTPSVRTINETLNALNEMYKVGLKAFVLPREMFGNITDASDIYKVHYGNLLKIKDLAKKYNIELSLHHPALTDQPDENLKIFCNLSSIMDCRTFIINPNFYSQMPHNQALKLVVYKINETIIDQRSDIKIGIENTGKSRELGNFEDSLDIVKRTQGTEPVINWGNIHARGAGALRTQEDFRRILEKTRQEIGPRYFSDAYFIFSGVSYGPSGKIKNIPLRESDIKLEQLIKEIMSFNIKGTIIFDDPQKEKFIIKMMESLADMVR